MKRFTAKEIEKIDNGKGYWNSSLVGVFDGEIQIGEYKRNYPSFASKTFYAFELNDKWYALYSKDYTATRIMSLPDCKDIGGEEPNGAGFCPTEFYVPELTGQILNPDDPYPKNTSWNTEKWALKVEKQEGKYTSTMYYFPDNPDHPEPNEEKKIAYIAEKEKYAKENSEWYERNPIISQFAKFGFVSGCVWGDDGSWKIQFLDLTKADQGIIVRDARFGYLELPVNVTLADAIDFYEDYYLNDPIEKFRVKIAVPVTYDLSGKEYKQ